MIYVIQGFLLGGAAMCVVLAVFHRLYYKRSGPSPREQQRLRPDEDFERGAPIERSIQWQRPAR
jgi:hypothetical protein